MAVVAAGSEFENEKMILMVGLFLVIAERKAIPYLNNNFASLLVGLVDEWSAPNVQLVSSL